MQLLFKGFYHGFGKLGKFISSLVNFFLLFLVFVFGIGLVSLFSKLYRKNFLNMKLDKNKSSYWEDSMISKRKKEDFYKPF